MTLLEFVISKYLGPPHTCRGDGQSEWPCPRCGHFRFHSMPDVPQYKHRARCWTCDFRGDCADMILSLDRHCKTPKQAFQRLAALEAEWRTADVEPVSSRGWGVDQEEADRLLDLMADYQPPRVGKLIGKDET